MIEPRKTFQHPSNRMPSVRGRIRRATLSDGHDITEVLRSSADWYQPLVSDDDLDQHDVSDVWFTRNFPKREFWALERDGEVVGVLTVQDAGRALYLGYVYVHVDHVGRGLGRILLEHARRLGWQRGKQALVLLVHPDAEWAVRAYDKFGFEAHCTDRQQVLSWNGGWLRDYYEDGFHLYRYALHDQRPH